MQIFEERALGTCRQTIPLWLRYVDGTFTAIHKDEIEAFNGHHNEQNADIQFIKEIKENEIPFLFGRPRQQRTTNDTVPKTDAYQQITWRIISTQSYDYKYFDKTSATSL